MIRRKKKNLQTESSRQTQNKSRMSENDCEYVVMAECKRESVESVCQYTKNDAYSSVPKQPDQRIFGPGVTLHGDNTLSCDQQQDMEPIYETISDTTLKSHTTV